MASRSLRRTALTVLLLATGCSRNPATGQLVFNTVTPAQEQAIGEQVAAEVEEAVGEYRDDQLHAYVEQVGQKVARVSERPELSWSFKVLDTWVPNAFAIAGGHVYVTRGLLAALDSEAELAAVLAHEVGHVTALHSAQSLSRRRVRTAGGLFNPRGRLTRSLVERREFAYSREQEHEADALSLRYLVAAGYDPRAAAKAIATLEAYTTALEARAEHEQLLRLPPERREEAKREAERAASANAVPAWKKSHPDSAQRVLRLREGAGDGWGDIGRDDYLDAIDGIVYGSDPREGFFAGNQLVHPAAGITMNLPVGWLAAASGEVLIAIHSHDAKGDEADTSSTLMIMFVSEQQDVQSAREAFFEEFPFERGEQWERDLGDTQSIAVGIGGKVWPDNLTGFAGFSRLQGKVFTVVAFSSETRWKEVGAEAFASFSSLRILRDPGLRNTQPVRLRVQSFSANTPVVDLGRASAGAIGRDEHAALNQSPADGRLPKGRAKIVVGRWPDLPAQALR